MLSLAITDPHHHCRITYNKLNSPVSFRPIISQSEEEWGARFAEIRYSHKMSRIGNNWKESTTDSNVIISPRPSIAGGTSDRTVLTLPIRLWSTQPSKHDPKCSPIDVCYVTVSWGGVHKSSWGRCAYSVIYEPLFVLSHRFVISSLVMIRGQRVQHDSEYVPGAQECRSSVCR